VDATRLTSSLRSSASDSDYQRISSYLTVSLQMVGRDECSWGVPDIRYYRGARIQVLTAVDSACSTTERSDVRWMECSKAKKMRRLPTSGFWNSRETDERPKRSVDAVEKVRTCITTSINKSTGCQDWRIIDLYSVLVNKKST